MMSNARSRALTSNWFWLFVLIGVLFGLRDAFPRLPLVTGRSSDWFTAFWADFISLQVYVIFSLRSFPPLLLTASLCPRHFINLLHYWRTKVLAINEFPKNANHRNPTIENGRNWSTSRFIFGRVRIVRQKTQKKATFDSWAILYDNKYWVL